MKKLFLFAALFAAISLNAKVVTIDLSKGTANNAELKLENNELTASYNLGAWGAGGVVFALDNLDVTELAFDYKGDTTVAGWVSFLVYLEDSQGGQWYSADADLSISEWDAEWASKNYMPSDVLWESSTAAQPVKPFKRLGFLANPENATKATFAIRNVKLTVPDETAIDNTAVEAKAVKSIQNGQLLILRDGKTYDALGTQIK